MPASNPSAADPVLLVFTTFPDPETARQIGSVLIEKQLAACVNLLSAATSIYRWNGQVETEEEIPGLLKTTQSGWASLQRELTKLHPYDEPEIIAVEVVGGTPTYLDWVRSEVGSS